MATTQNNKPILHLPQWQPASALLAATAAGSFIIKDPLGVRRTALHVNATTAQYLYRTDKDSWMQIPSMGLGGTFGAGACGCWMRWSNTLTATGGTTTSLTLTTGITDLCEGRTLRFLTGTNAGKEVTITKASVNVGGTNTITFAETLSNAVTTETFAIGTGLYLVWNAGTMSATSFKSYDPLTGVVTALSVTGAPATWGTDGKMCATPSYVGAYATGTATSGTNTTLVNSAKAWTANQWCNYQVRITAGTGIGQTRTITTNTATTLTVPTWTVTPDATSVYAIEANDDFAYLAGNNAVTMYRYSRSGNSWTTLAPTTARSAAPSTGMGLNWVGKSGNSDWANESAIKNGRYIYSVRGGGTSNIDRYDITGGTNGAGAWLALTYINAAETFTTGSCTDMANNGRIIIRKDATNRFFYYDAVYNYIHPLAINLYADGTAVLGDKLFTVVYNDGGDDIEWLYSVRNSGTEMHRLMIY